jgi:signal transduction histidine kinase
LVHELRAPLTVIRGATDMFLSDPMLCSKDQGKEILTTMRHSSEDMLSMINDLLDVYKIEAGKFQVLKTRNNLADIIHDRVVFFSQLAKAKGISLSAQITDHTLTANFDRERISQVLNNLLSNAIKFTSASGRVIVTATKINSPSEVPWRFSPVASLTLTNLPALLVAVSDTGTGIPPENMQDLFSKFKQLHALDDRGSSGLGLAIAKGIIESHGGRIFLESRPNEGTTVYFTIPLTFSK